MPFIGYLLGAGFEKYINAVPSIPGTQVMIPAGTVHASGRNQVILEIGSLTVGSYTYKLYDYLRADLLVEGDTLRIFSVHLQTSGIAQLRRRFQNAGLVLGHRQDHHLHRCDLGGQHQTVVVTVGHDDAADETGGYAPGGLVGVGTLIVFIGKGDVKSLGKAVAEVVGGACLEGLPVCLLYTSDAADEL